MKYKDREHYDGTKDWKNYYWFYYKWHMLAALFLAVTIFICTAQCAMRVEPDYYVLFYSDGYIMDTILDEITTELCEFSEDTNGDGKVKVQAINCSYSSKDSMSKTTAHQKAVLQMQETGACIWVLDDSGVETYHSAENVNLFAKLRVFNQLDNHAIKVNELKCFDILGEAAGKDHDYYVFCRKDKDGKTAEIGEKVINKILK